MRGKNSTREGFGWKRIPLRELLAPEALCRERNVYIPSPCFTWNAENPFVAEMASFPTRKVLLDDAFQKSRAEKFPPKAYPKC